MTAAVDTATGEILEQPEAAPSIGPDLAAALVAAVGKLTNPRQDSKAIVPTKAGGAYGYGYLSLAGLTDAVRPVLAAHGLAVLQPVQTGPRGVGVTTTLLHQSGQSWTPPTLWIPSGRSPQEIGSATTYGRRYQLAAMLGLAPEDDDGQQAQQATRRQQQNAGGEPTRPVARAQARPDDPANEPYQRPPVAEPMSASQRGKLMAMLRETGRSKDEQRAWCAATLHRPEGEEFHFDSIDRGQASVLINHLSQPGMPGQPTPPEPA